jgi:hypothetical protein
VIDPRTGSGRTLVGQDEIGAFQSGGSLVIDDRRRRPLYFDGRFLAARDLVREQAYFLTRQADIARSAGFGAMQGLMVRNASAADAVTIFSGQGVTPSGELVIIPADHTISLSNVPEDQKLNANFGLMPIPKEPSRNRSGLYVLGLRAVEFSANPIASYPTSITGPRTVHDGDIVEATAITLVHYPDTATNLELSARRSFVAREVFFSGTLRGVPNAVLPLAMLALNHGNVEWIDSYMVRRELGAEYGDLLRFSTGTRAMQQAFILQYDAQLNDVLSQRQHAGQGVSFPATQYFYALPPCGRLPMACINAENFTQSFFPQEMDVQLSVVPQDELPSLIEEAVGLPPIDLMQPAQSFQNISVLVLAAVPRQQFAQIKSKLETVALQPVVPAAIAARSPLDLLHLRKGPLPSGPVTLPPANTANALWKETVATPFAYYIRLRSAPESVEITVQGQPDAAEIAKAAADRAAAKKAAADKAAADKAAADKAAADKAAADKAAPDKSAADKAAADKAAADKAAADKAAADKAAADKEAAKVAAAKAAADKAAADKAQADRLAAAKAAADKAAADKAAAAKVEAARVAAAKAAAAKAAADKAAAAKAAAEQAAAARAAAAAKAAAAKAAAAKSVPVKSVPVKSVPVKSVPVKSVPVKSVPVKSVPAKSIPRPR